MKWHDNGYHGKFRLVDADGRIVVEIRRLGLVAHTYGFDNLEFIDLESAKAFAERRYGAVSEQE